MEQRETYLIVGLGNPGRRFKENRHNIGFALVTLLADRWRMEFSRMQSDALVCDTRRAGHKIILAKPQTWMNSSGRAVAALQRFFKVDLANLIVAFDDLDLPSGTIRVRPGGGSGGHKGMESIIQHLGSDEFPRIRLGIGRPPGKMDPADYVLQDFKAQEQEPIEAMLQRGAVCVELLLDEGLQACMNHCNPAET
ncbi:MAG: aminoacyl-tRNA hydrolase [Anaerolineales bacterium]|jgi:PTH1 family peptidyl-tRNA hydrolase